MADIKLTTNHAAAVNTQLFWLPVSKYPPPRGTKLQLIDRRAGVAHYGQYRDGDSWTHWQGLPRFAEDDHA